MYETISELASLASPHRKPASCVLNCLPNPYWEPQLRPLSGNDAPVKNFLDAQPLVQEMIAAIAGFLEEWIPRYQDFQRSYLTVAIGCTGGMHRSVYVAEALVRGEKEDRQKGSLLRSCDRYRPIVPSHLERSKDPELHAHRLVVRS